MTREQLDAIRNNVDFNDVSIHDVIPLLVEVKRLHEENTVLVEANEGEPWAWQVLTKQRDAALAEVERLNALGALLSADIQRLTRRVAENEVDWMALRTEAATAFKRGVAAMREAAAKECWNASDELAGIPDMATEQGELQVVATRIRALPDPEDK